MKFKKLISMAVTAAMVFALAAPVFAAPGGTVGDGSTTLNTDPSTEPTTPSDSTSPSDEEGEAAENTVAVASSIETPTVTVTVPTSGAVILNPYQMKFTVSGTDYYKPFFSAPIICKNESDCDLNVSASASVKVAGGVKIVDAANSVQTADAGDKNVWIEMQSGTFADKDSTAFATPANDLKFTFEQANKGYGYGAKGEGITIEDKYLNLPYSEDATYFGFILNGDANKNAKEVWTAADKVSVTIVLTFIPQAIAANANK